MQAGAKRLVAVKARICDVQASAQVSDPSGPTGLLMPTGLTAYRVNLLGAVVSEPEVNEGSAAFVIDDGTGSLVIRTFESPQRMAGLQIGTVVTVIGRPRPASDGMFIAPEIIKATSSDWMAVRKKEIEALSMRPMEKITLNSTPRASTPPGPAVNASSAHPKLAGKLGAIEEEVVIEEKADASPERKICDLIRKNDAGGGADAAKVVADSGMANADTLIEKLLKNGDIFAVGPGRFKVLD
ncbi:MAG: hypothetical protein AABX47_00780 [Nanoarchaeota archaeon]